MDEWSGMPLGNTLEENGKESRWFIQFCSFALKFVLFNICSKCSKFQFFPIEDFSWRCYASMFPQMQQFQSTAASGSKQSQIFSNCRTFGHFYARYLPAVGLLGTFAIPQTCLWKVWYVCRLQVHIRKSLKQGEYISAAKNTKNPRKSRRSVKTALMSLEYDR